MVTAYPENKGVMILFVLLSYAKEIWFRSEMHKEEFDQSCSQVFKMLVFLLPSQAACCPVCAGEHELAELRPKHIYFLAGNLPWRRMSE